MLKIRDDIDLKELEKFIGIELYVNNFKTSTYLITGICIDNYMKDICKRQVCFELDYGDDVINIEKVGNGSNEFVLSKQLNDLIKDGLVEKVEKC